ncbi:MAG: UDP-N-acetylmuramoyl-L-alanyl-D-glutamate--2,6-diaminopimelate ligase [Pseudomonadota bacterium]
MIPLDPPNRPQKKPLPSAHSVTVPNVIQSISDAMTPGRLAEWNRSAEALLEQLKGLGINPTNVVDDSRQVAPGDLFLAYPGATTDGRCYIGEAIERGAAAVFWESAISSLGGYRKTLPSDNTPRFAWSAQWQVPNFPVANLGGLSGCLAQLIYNRPSERLSLLALTGTNGKTTISHALAQSYPGACAMIGTLGAGRLGQLQDIGLTTPTATALTRYLAECVSDTAQPPISACALEASSIGLVTGRLNGLHIDVAVFTNLTRDHLDFHTTLAAYAEAKERLFHWPALRLAVINIDDFFGRELLARTTAKKVLTYTQSNLPSNRLANLRAENVEETASGLSFWLSAPNGRAQVQTSLMGRYNVSNLLAVAAVLIDAGLTPNEVASRFAKLTPPPGRLEVVRSREAIAEPLVIVDYAHTPDALEKALRALRPVLQRRSGHSPAKLHVVFGCGGERDRGKRLLMGSVAMAFADRVLLTSDNPRREDPQTILHEILRGAPNAESVLDRATAIRQAVLNADNADVILIAGKGHELYQDIAGERHPFSDFSEAQAALDERRLQANPAHASALASAPKNPVKERP